MIQCKKLKSQQTDIFTNQAYQYHGIVTTDGKATPQEIFCFYNQRAKSENIFEKLKQDFNWNALPNSFLDCNTMFMILASIIYVIFECFKRHIAKHFTLLPANAWVKKFIYTFADVAAQWIRTASQNVLKIFSPINYQAIPLKI